LIHNLRQKRNAPVNGGCQQGNIKACMPQFIS
jgi:hypothetical protein